MLDYFLNIAFSPHFSMTTKITASLESPCQLLGDSTFSELCFLDDFLYSIELFPCRCNFNKYYDVSCIVQSVQAIVKCQDMNTYLLTSSSAWYGASSKGNYRAVKHYLRLAFVNMKKAKTHLKFLKHISSNLSKLLCPIEQVLLSSTAHF